MWCCSCLHGSFSSVFSDDFKSTVEPCVDPKECVCWVAPHGDSRGFPGVKTSLFASKLCVLYSCISKSKESHVDDLCNSLNGQQDDQAASVLVYIKQPPPLVVCCLN